ncbi:hypothetical protein EVAR_51246_1 [Eumeta japonica]|uniref:Uncharacterized protein n=1 Tax=Eumeta variegata TaxID=151549 RepID=A0A4C1X4V2_EUMVA|nr:hypothetical protein EVAR_51246_1 [Eumeta japonica]
MTPTRAVRSYLLSKATRARYGQGEAAAARAQSAARWRRGAARARATAPPPRAPRAPARATLAPEHPIVHPSKYHTSAVGGYCSTMTAICFVCNLPILSHQVGLVWAGGNGWDELTRGQLEESMLRQRLGNRRDSAAQVSCLSPPEPDPSDQPRGAPRRRRSSLAQLTDILRDWSNSGSAPRRQRAPLSRRETLADLARSLPWARHEPPPRRRRDSSADSGIKSMASKRRDSKIAPPDFRSDFPSYWDRRDSSAVAPARERRLRRRGSGDEPKERRGSGDGHRQRRDSTAAGPSACRRHAQKTPRFTPWSRSTLIRRRFFRSGTFDAATFRNCSDCA